MYLDTDNLYGEAMAKYLPIIGLKWLIAEGNMDVCIIHSKSNYRYILKNLQHLQKVHIRFSTTTNNFVFLWFPDSIRKLCMAKTTCNML